MLAGDSGRQPTGGVARGHSEMESVRQGVEQDGTPCPTPAEMEGSHPVWDPQFSLPSIK